MVGEGLMCARLDAPATQLQHTYMFPSFTFVGLFLPISLPLCLLCILLHPSPLFIYVCVVDGKDGRDYLAAEMHQVIASWCNSSSIIIIPDP